jgi:hypothetical protein
MQLLEKDGQYDYVSYTRLSHATIRIEETSPAWVYAGFAWTR